MKIDAANIPTIADEYVLGLLDEADTARVDTDIEHNAELAAAIAKARDRFLPLDTGIEPSSVSSGLWDTIDKRLSGNTGNASTRSVSQRLPIAGNDNGRSGWRAAAISAMAASLILAGGLIWSVTRTVEPLVVAVLLNEAGEVQAVVEDFGNDTASVRLLTDFAVPADKTMQVWTLPSREMGPMSLGLLEGSQSKTLSGSTLPRPQDTQLYEITLEQAGGSPTGRPTGPILAKGFAKLAR